jgi:RNA polymerase sigma factor (sigma-70 family)
MTGWYDLRDEMISYTNVPLANLIPKAEGKEFPMAYFQRSVKNHLNNFLRAQNKDKRRNIRTALPLDELVDDSELTLNELLCDERYSPSVLDGTLDTKIVSNKLANLPDRFRIPLELTFSGHTQIEIANLTGLSLSGAKKRVRDGKERLRTALNEAGYEF